MYSFIEWVYIAQNSHTNTHGKPNTTTIKKSVSHSHRGRRLCGRPTSHLSMCLNNITQVHGQSRDRDYVNFNGSPEDETYSRKETFPIKKLNHSVPIRSKARSTISPGNSSSDRRVSERDAWTLRWLRAREREWESHRVLRMYQSSLTRFVEVTSCGSDCLHRDLYHRGKKKKTQCS